jgi:hypothetical protein
VTKRNSVQKPEWVTCFCKIIWKQVPPEDVIIIYSRKLMCIKKH